MNHIALFSFILSSSLFSVISSLTINKALEDIKTYAGLLTCASWLASTDSIETFRELPTTNISAAEQDFSSKPIRVLIHGYKSGISLDATQKFDDIERAYESHHKNLNLVTVKWNSGSLLYKPSSKYAAENVSIALAKYLDENLGTDEKAWRNLKIIGHSLGAHVAGICAKNVRNGKVGAIIGLDPAKPGFEGRPENARLSENDATYTECFHTNTRCYGIKEPICQVNFYPNSGKSQPACKTPHCDHTRSYVLYTESLVNNNFLAAKCENITNLDCTGPEVSMGGEPGNIDKSVEKGVYYLTTNGVSPYGKGIYGNPKWNETVANKLKSSKLFKFFRNLLNKT